MPLYDKRCFVSSFRRNGIAVVCYVQRDMRLDTWEIEYCNSVTKERVFGTGLPVIATKTRDEALKQLRSVYANSKT